jgi:mRNA-degrading endonuclease toxin of MazEF toxin-antitoxin module
MTSSLSFGAVVRVRDYPFTDQEGSKTAPAVVLSSSRYHEECTDVILARITSRLQNKTRFGSVVVQDFVACGLSKESVIKPVIMTVRQDLVHDVLGQLDARTLANLRRAFNTVLGFDS